MGTPVNLLLRSQKCQVVPFSPICQNVLPGAPLVLTPLVRRQQTLMVFSIFVSNKMIITNIIIVRTIMMIIQIIIIIIIIMIIVMIIIMMITITNR